MADKSAEKRFESVRSVLNDIINTHNYNTNAISELAGVHRDTIDNLRDGKTKNPNAKKIAAILIAVGATDAEIERVEKAFVREIAVLRDIPNREKLGYLKRQEAYDERVKKFPK